MALIILISGLAGYFFISGYLSSDAFRHNLEQRLAKQIQVDTVKLSPLEWGGASFGTESIAANGQQLLRELEIGKIDAVIDRSAIFDQHLRVKDLTIDHININLVHTEQDDKPPVDDHPVLPGQPAPRPPAPPSGAVPPDQPDQPAPSARPTAPTPKKEKHWLARRLTPNRYTLDSAAIRSFSLSYTYQDEEEQKQYAIRNVRARISPLPGNNEYRMLLEQGSISVPFNLVSVGNLEGAVVRMRPDHVTFSEGRVRPNYGGLIDVEGEWEKMNSRWWANLVVKDVKCINLLSPDWKKRIDGMIEGTVRLRGENGELVEAGGRARVENGVLTALPVLDTLAAFTRTSKFRRITFNLAEADYRYHEKNWRISNIVLASDGLIRIEGWIEIHEDDTLTGRLSIGVVPGILSNIPGAEEKVFLPDNNARKMGLLWTNVNISGTLDSPREDLSARLVAAAGDRLFQIIPDTGQRVLLFSGDLASRLLGAKVPGLNGGKDRDAKDNDEKNKGDKPTEILIDSLDRARELLPF